MSLMRGTAHFTSIVLLLMSNFSINDQRIKIKCSQNFSRLDYDLT